MSVQFYPERLNAAIARAYAESIRAAAAEAKAAAPAAEAEAAVVQTGPTTATLKATGRLGAIMEEGTRPHVIEGKHGYLYLRDSGTFVSGTIYHPGTAAQPYVRPAALHWATSLFHTVARANLNAAGF